MSWDPSGTTFIGPANLCAEVEVDRSGNNYRGPFSVTQYDTNGNTLAYVVGVIAPGELQQTNTDNQWG